MLNDRGSQSFQVSNEDEDQVKRSIRLHQISRITTTSAAGSATGAVIGVVANIALGSAVGSVFPGAGTLVGGVIGGLIGAVSLYRQNSGIEPPEVTQDADVEPPEVTDVEPPKPI